jgi:hypothetical protein
MKVKRLGCEPNVQYLPEAPKRHLVWRRNLNPKCTPNFLDLVSIQDGRTTPKRSDVDAVP